MSEIIINTRFEIALKFYIDYNQIIGGSREGPGGHVPPPDNWTVPLLHRFHGRFRGGPGGHVRPNPYWTVLLLRGF